LTSPSRPFRPLRPFGPLSWLLAALFLVTSGRALAASGGHLVIIGGGSRPPSVTEQFIRLAGGATAARLVVIPLASEDTATTGRRAVEEFKALGVSRVEVLPSAPEEADRVMRQATGVYLTGGDQQRLVDALAGTRVVGALHELLRRGGVIGGTSAGAAVMSARMITGEERGITKEDDRFRSIQREQIETTNGFGFLTNAVVDQHFIARKRANRLFSVVLENPRLIGIGIDESTAVVVGPDQSFEVVGDRSVMVIDARHSGLVRTGTDRRLAATGLRVHVLVAGDRFDLKRGKPMPARKPN
jgi:cyanophycinase